MNKSVLRNPFVWAFVIGVITLTLIRPLLRRVPEPPPVIGNVPPFTLVDSRGEPFGSDDLRGQVYVANFFFTSCRSICLPMMRAVALLDERYRSHGVEGIQIVSISVDPDTDTPDVLRDYGEKLGADPAHWTLLTGDLPEIEALVVGGFKTALGEKAETEGGFFDIAHSGKLVLVDRDGKIRGYYDHDEAGRDEVFHRSQHVRGHSPFWADEAD